MFFLRVVSIPFIFAHFIIDIFRRCIHIRGIAILLLLQITNYNNNCNNNVCSKFWYNQSVDDSTRKKKKEISHKRKVRFFRWKVRFRKELGHLPQNNLGQRADLWTISPALVILTKRFSKSTNLHIWWYWQKFQLRWPFFLFLNSFFI